MTSQVAHPFAAFVPSPVRVYGDTAMITSVALVPVFAQCPISGAPAPAPSSKRSHTVAVHDGRNRSTGSSAAEGVARSSSVPVLLVRLEEPKA